MSEDSRLLDPTIIPAQPGYRVVSFSVVEESLNGRRPQAKDVYQTSDAVIAWMVRPTVHDSYPNNLSPEAMVDPVTIEGVPTNFDFLVTPDGRWTIPSHIEVETEHDARLYYLQRNYPEPSKD